MRGIDPMVFLRRNIGPRCQRPRQAIKAKPNALIGDDELPWKDILHLCETTAGVGGIIGTKATPSRHLSVWKRRSK
jgi:hypothetical protein